MLDENLPTFRLKPSSENPLSTILYFTQNGSDPSAEYVLRRPDPALPASHNKYGIALCDPYNQDVIYGEVLVEPELSQPTLSAAEIRAQAQAGVAAAPATAIVPDNFTIQLYNPDQSIAMRMAAGTWGKSDSWEFEVPVQAFHAPTISQLDREQQTSSPAEADLTPRIMFRWKREGKLSKDMTCYMTGTNTAGRKSKEPDITIAMYKAGRESAVTIYQPNLHRVELEDRKGLEIILLLSSEVIKDLYLSPKPSMFNVQGGGSVLNVNKRKNSRPNNNAVAGAATGAVVGTAMSGALNNAPPKVDTPVATPPPVTTAASNIAPPGAKPGVTFTSTPTANIEAETRRLQEMVEREKREREKVERAEQKRIQKMLDEEDKARLRREAEITKETERLRKKYGVEGQDLPSDRPSLPPRPQGQTQPSPTIQTSSPPSPPPQFPPPEQPLHGPSWLGAPPPTLPPRPVSAGPYSRPTGGVAGSQEQGPFHCSKLNVLWKGAAGQLQQIQHQVENRVSAYQLQQQQQHQGGGEGQPLGSGRRRSDEERKKVQKKRSSHW